MAQRVETDKLNIALDDILDRAIDAMVQAGMTGAPAAYRAMILKSLERMPRLLCPDHLRLDLEGYARTVQAMLQDLG